MRSAFTLIELIVVMVIFSLTLAMVIPKGVKLLNSSQNTMTKMTEKQTLSKERAKAFLNVQDKEVSIGSNVYSISSKGVITTK